MHRLINIQMSEEIENAVTVVPQGIMYTILINGGLGFGMLIVTLFSLNDVQGALNSPTGFPFMQIFLESTASAAGSTCLAAILIVMQYVANVGLLASASRMCWSFARDRGLPGWKWLQHVRNSLAMQEQFSPTFSCDTNRVRCIGEPSYIPSNQIHYGHYRNFHASLPHHSRLVNRIQ